MNAKNLGMINYIFIVCALLLCNVNSFGASNQSICEDLPNLDYAQPYPNSMWNQFDVGNDQGISGDGHLKFTLDTMINKNNVAIGLDHSPTDSVEMESIDYAFYFIKTNTKNIVRIYENGALKITLFNSSASIDGYNFEIKRTEEVVEYYMNDVLKYTSLIPSQDPLYYDNACRRRTSASVFSASDIKICIPGTPDASTIMVNSAYIDGKIRLRWMTTEMRMWEHATKVGYTIERITVAEDGVYLSKNERLASYVLLEEAYIPKSLDELQLATSNPNEGILANRLIKDPDTENSIMEVGSGSQTLAKAVEQKNMRDIRYFYAHVLAEKSFAMACAMGMAYEDDTIESDKEYAYIITLTEPLN